MLLTFFLLEIVLPFTFYSCQKKSPDKTNFSNNNEHQYKTTANQKQNVSEYSERDGVDVNVVTSSLGFDENSNDIETSLLSLPPLHSNNNRPDDDVDVRPNNESVVEQPVHSVKREITFEKQNEDHKEENYEEDDDQAKKMEYAFGSSFDKTERSNSLISERSRKHSQNSRKSSIKAALDDEPPSKPNESPSKTIAQPHSKSKKKRKSTKKLKNMESKSADDATHREANVDETPISNEAAPQQQQQKMVDTDEDTPDGKIEIETENLSNSKDSLQSSDRHGNVFFCDYREY